MNTIDISNIQDTLVTQGAEYLPQLGMAVLTFIVGWFLINHLMKILDKVFKSKRFEDSLAGFIKSLSKIGLRIFLIIIVVGMLGVQTSSLVALLGAAGLAVGLALQGSLANFAGGVLILMFKPFKVGDYIETDAGHAGYVQEIQIFYTILKTLDHHFITIPNGTLSNNPVNNFSEGGPKRVDVSVGISYGDDVAQARDILVAIMKRNDKILQDPEPFVFLNELADSSLNLVCRFWIEVEDSFIINGYINEEAKKAFDKEGISIPFPQQDVYLHHVENK